MGTGTTGAVAKSLGRHFIGIEKEKKYILSAQERIKNVKTTLDEIATLEKDKKPPKVLFSHLVKQGRLSNDKYLYTPQKKRARILPDGRLKVNGLMGSIHQLAAKLQNKTVANGWNYWLIKTKSGYIGIDILRKKR